MNYKAKPRLTFSEALKCAYKKGFDDNRHRVRRSEYWWNMLALLIYLLVFAAIYFLVEDVLKWRVLGRVWNVIFGIFSIIPCGIWVMESYGRLHDTNHRDTWLHGFFLPCVVMLIYNVMSVGSGYSATQNTIVYSLLGAVAAIFGVICLVFCLKDSDKGENDYGASPKYEATDD